MVTCRSADLTGDEAPSDVTLDESAVDKVSRLGREREGNNRKTIATFKTQTHQKTHSLTKKQKTKTKKNKQTKTNQTKPNQTKPFQWKPNRFSNYKKIDRREARARVGSTKRHLSLGLLGLLGLSGL